MGTAGDGLCARDALTKYVRGRLKRECRQRGAMGQIARSAGIHVASLRNIVHAHRGVGDSIAHTLAAYWGLTYGDLERLAMGIPLRAEDDPHPNLSATLSWCKTDHPHDVLAAYAKIARRSPTDRSRID